ADVVVEGGRIVAVGRTSASDRDAIVDASGLVVAPGFIDSHSHADFTLPANPAGDALLRQGCTTVVTGNCGFSPWPFAHGATADAREHGRFLDVQHDHRWRSLDEYAATLDRAGLGVNVAPLCGHGAARTGVLGSVDRPASGGERDEVVSLIERALDDGAFGVSFGLSYPHGRAADRAELAAVAATTAAHGGVLAVHLRDEGAELLEAVAEMTTLADDAGCRLQLSHHKAAGLAQRGLVARSLEMIDVGRASGIDVAIDAYPYTMGATTLAAALPDWCTGSGDDELRRLVTADATRDRLLVELRAGTTRFTLPEIWVAGASPRWQGVVGGLLVDRAAELRRDPAELLLDVVATEGSSASMLVFCMAPDDVHAVLRHPGTIVGSDGWVLEPAPGVHPRNFQTFPQMLDAGFRRTVGLDLGDAVARMTGDVAMRFGISDRGAIAPGYAADLVLFDPDRIGPGGSLGDPAGPPRGVHAVFVNGLSGIPAGRVLRRSRSQRPRNLRVGADRAADR
ncbi:MAG: amidohydrolase family protein, partial [Actinobacteria bacterium]|nr:amidohydrolase family protein [Actinomycetota bacterium]